MNTTSAPALTPSLGTLQLWGIAVGLVISGEYFGWSYGWASAGTLGYLVTTVFVALGALGYAYFVATAKRRAGDAPAGALRPSP
jgi:amino acid transporter